MPLKDHIRTLKDEFNNIKNDFNKFTNQSSQGHGYGQQNQYPGQIQHQNYGEYPQSQSNGQHSYGQLGGQQYPPSQGQNYEQAAWQMPPPQQWNQQQPYQQVSQPYPAQVNGHGHSRPVPSTPSQSAPPSKPQPQPPTQSHNPTDYYNFKFHPSIPVSTYFEHETGDNGWGNNEAQNYTSSPNNSFHASSNLILRAISAPSQPNKKQRYTSARLLSHQKLSRSSGCLTAVVTSPSASGIWPALWLLPYEPMVWPIDGEIDIAESWMGDNTNHSCLHWGQYNGADAQKHRVRETPIPAMAQRQVKYEFIWQQSSQIMKTSHKGSKPERAGGGWMMWLIDGTAVMKTEIPTGIRRLEDFQVVINVAMGGNVCDGKLPKEGIYDFVIHELRMSGEPDGGWGRVDPLWHTTPEGNTM
jgi:hypothetical protein